MIKQHKRFFGVGHLENRLPTKEELNQQQSNSPNTNIPFSSVDTGEVQGFSDSDSDFPPFNSSPVCLFACTDYNNKIYIHPQITKFINKWGINYMKKLGWYN